MKKYQISAGLMLGFMSFATPIWSQETNEPPPALVEVETVKQEMIAQHIWVPGTVVSRADSNIASEVPGRITWMADVGDLVEAGDVLVKVDDHLLQLNFQQDQANIAMWESRVTLLQRKQVRFNSMALKANTSEDQLDEIISELEIAKQELAQARVDKDLTQYRIDQSQIKAPFTALIVERLQNLGEFIATGQTLLRIVDTQNVEASIKAPLSAIPFIEQGLTVQVNAGGKDAIRPIRTIVPVGSQRSRAMEIRVKLLPEDFAIGRAVRVALPHSLSHEGLTVPRDALVLRKAGAFVYQVGPDNEAVQVVVTTGVGMGDRIEVFGALNNLAPVVVRGAEQLREGQKVRFSDTTPQIAKL